MALIKCPKCDKTISDQSVNCPHCGHLLQSLSDVVEEKYGKIVNIMDYVDIQIKEIEEEREAAAKDTIARCPKCGSTSLSAGKQGINFGGVAMGMLYFGALGLLAGAAKGANKTIVTCLNCGYKYYL